MRISIYIIYLYRETTSANGCTLIFVYMTYTMLPVRLREAIFGGIILSTAQICAGIYGVQNTNWSQVNNIYTFFFIYIAFILYYKIYYICIRCIKYYCVYINN